MRASANRKTEKQTVFYLIIAAAMLYNLFLLFASDETALSHTNSENEVTASTLSE
jgi:hypothetical protein